MTLTREIVISLLARSYVAWTTRPLKSAMYCISKSHANSAVSTAVAMSIVNFDYRLVKVSPTRNANPVHRRLAFPWRRRGRQERMAVHQMLDEFEGDVAVLEALKVCIG